MNVSRESVSALQRHFLGALSTPARMWLEPLPPPRLAFAGSALRTSGRESVLDFGTVETPAEALRTVRMYLPGREKADIQLDAFPPWIEPRWTDPATLELLARHDAEGELAGSLRFLVDGRAEDLLVSMKTRSLHPAARFDFNGAPAPRLFDFRWDDPPYRLSVRNDASVPLVVSFADLPAWLAFEVDGQSQNGPLPGRFFERTAPFAVAISPQHLGRHEGTIRVRTNAPDPELAAFELRFAGCLEPARPLVRAIAPRAVRLRANQTHTVEATLENWGRTPARMVKARMPRGVKLPAAAVVPPAHDGTPGTAKLPIRIVPAQLAHGRHTLPLALRIEEGDPPEVTVPVQVEVVAAVVRATPWRAAVLALLLLTLVLFVVRGMP